MCEQRQQQESWCFFSSPRVPKALAAVASGGSSFHSLMVLGRNKNSFCDCLCVHVSQSVLVHLCVYVFMCGAGRMNIQLDMAIM